MQQLSAFMELLTVATALKSRVAEVPGMGGGAPGGALDCAPKGTGQKWTHHTSVPSSALRGGTGSVAAWWLELLPRRCGQERSAHLLVTTPSAGTISSESLCSDSGKPH